MSIAIRHAVESDVPQIFELIRGLAEYEKLADKVVANEEKIRETLFGTRPCAEVLMADFEGRCAGFALFFPNYSTFLAQPGIYLEDLFVKPIYRGKGVGLALLKKIAALAMERGCGRLDWEVLDWNEPSIAFYRKLGALALEDWTRYRLTGAAILALARD